MWLVELKEWNYIEWAWFGSSRKGFRIRQRGWKEIEKYCSKRGTSVQRSGESS